MNETLYLRPPNRERSPVSEPGVASPSPPFIWGILRPGAIENGALLGDVVTILLCGLASGIFYEWLTAGTSLKGLGLFGISAISAINFVLINLVRRNYRLKTLQLMHAQLREVPVIWATICGLLAVAGFTMKISGDYSRGGAILFLLSGLVGVLVWRMMIAQLISRSLASDAFAKKKIIVIAERNRAISSQALPELRRHGYVPITICCLTELEMSSSGASSSLRAKLDSLVELARRDQVEEFYILIGWNYLRAIDAVVDALSTLALPLHLLPDESAVRFLRVPIVEIGKTWTVPLRRPPLSKFELAIKRGLDISGSLFGLVALAPLLLMTAILIKLDSRGPVFFRQKRSGFNGRAFSIFKFRTMHVLEDGGEVRQATINDPRITRLGLWLRRTSIDEIPQLFNVLNGEMSLVGPRPHACSHDSKYEKLIASYAFRHHVKPGLTGWAQVNGYRGETPRIELMQRRVEHDLWYINNWSFVLDIRIVLKTAIVTLFQRTAY
jgi:Undecaprenyl-phosphate glucose phosphotransferase